MDFDCAESLAAKLAVGRLVNRCTGSAGQQFPIGVNQRQDTADKKSPAAVAFGKDSIKGDKFHFCQSVTCASETILRYSHRPAFKTATKTMLETTSKEEFDQAVQDIFRLPGPRVRTFLEWWLRGDTPGKIFRFKMNKNLITKNPPSASLSEPINSDEQRCATGKYLPIVTALHNSLLYSQHFMFLYRAVKSGRCKPRKGKKSPAHRRGPNRRTPRPTCPQALPAGIPKRVPLLPITVEIVVALVVAV